MDKSLRFFLPTYDSAELVAAALRQSSHPHLQELAAQLAAQLQVVRPYAAAFELAYSDMCKESASNV